MDKRFRNLIGPQVRARRMKREWSQSELATKLQLAGLTHLDRIGVAKIESQVRSVYDYEMMVIAEVLGVSPGAICPDEAEVAQSLSRLVKWSGE